MTSRYARPPSETSENIAKEFIKRRNRYDEVIEQIRQAEKLMDEINDLYLKLYPLRIIRSINLINEKNLLEGNDNAKLLSHLHETKEECWKYVMDHDGCEISEQIKVKKDQLKQLKISTTFSDPFDDRERKLIENHNITLDIVDRCNEYIDIRR